MLKPTINFIDCGRLGQTLVQHTDYAPLYALLSEFSLALTPHDAALKQQLQTVLAAELK